MPLVVPTFASTVDAMNNRMKARQEGKVPQGYLSDYDWNQYGRKLEAENKQIAAEQEAERQANPQPSGPTDPMLAASVQRRQRMLGGGPPPSTARPPDINDRPADYTDFKTKGWAMGSTARGRNAIGGVTNFPNMNDPGFGGYSGGGMRPAGSRTIGGRATPPAPDMFGRQFGQPDAPATDYEPGPAPMGTTTDGDNFGRLRMNAPKPYKPGLLGLAEGGEVEGPGGPKDDMVPAMLSDGEFIMPAEAVKFFGLDRLEKMKAKAKEGLMEMKASQPPAMNGGMMHMAAGGYVVPPSIERALADQSVAAESNYISPAAIIPTEGGGRFNRAGGANTGWEPEGMGHFLFPQPGIDASQRAQASTGRAIADIGQFMDAQPAIDAGFDAQTARRRAMLDSLNDPAAVARMAAEAPNPYRAVPAKTGGVDTGMAYAPNMNDHPAFNAPDPQTLADMRARRAAIRAADTIPGMIPPTFEPQPPVPTFAPRYVGGPSPSTPPILNSSSSTFMAPWEKDAARAAAADAASGRPAGVRKSDWRNFQRSPQGMMFGIQRQDQQAAEVKQDARTAVKDQQDIADRNLRIAEFQQNQERYQKAADAGDRDAQLRLAQFNLDVSKTQMDMQPEQWNPIRGTDYLTNGKQVIPAMSNQADAALPKRLKELDALMADTKQPLHIRELAKRERERAARETIQGGGEVKAPKLAQVPGGADSAFMPVSVQWDAKAGGWAPIQMADGKASPASSSAPAVNAAADRIAALRKKAGL